MTPLVEAVLSIARSQLGVREHPPGSNRGPEVDGYLMSVGLDPTQGSYPWCSAFVSWVIHEAGEHMTTPPKFKGSASVERLYLKNLEHMRLAGPEPGSVFIHFVKGTSGPGHTGFVVSVNDDGSLATIEGNSDGTGSRTGGQVVEHVRQPGYCHAFLRIE